MDYIHAVEGRIFQQYALNALKLTGRSHKADQEREAMQQNRVRRIQIKMSMLKYNVCQHRARLHCLPPRGACMRRLHAASSPQLVSFAQSDDIKACAISSLAFVPVRVSSSAASSSFVGGNPCWCPHKSTCSKADIQQCCCREKSDTQDDVCSASGWSAPLHVLRLALTN